MKLALPKRRLRIAFFGTPDIAKTILDRLFEANEDDVVLVLCQPDKPKGRGRELAIPPVKASALGHSVPVHQPAKLKDGTVAELLRGQELDLAVVVAYGRILPADVFRAPAFGTWNVHASLLPRHRGASPIQHAILEGDAETGVSLMELTEGLDEGPVFCEQRIPLNGTETAGTLTASLAELGATLLVEALRRGKKDGLEATPQDPSRATYARLIEKADGRLSFQDTAVRLARQVRAFDPWPGAFVPDGAGQPIKILRAEAREGSGPPAAPGQVVGLEDGLVVQTGSGVLAILELQLPGKRPVSARDYLRAQGRDLRIGSAFPAC